MSRAPTDEIASAYATAAAAFAGVRVDVARFAAWIDARTTPGESLGLQHASDLYLACACAAGDPAAAQHLHERVLSQVGAFIGHIDGAPSFADEVRQILAERLLSGGRIADYAGRGALGGWVRVAAVRAALDLKRQDAAHAQRTERAAADALTPDNPEIQHLKQRYRGEFESAFAVALASLEPEQRHVLRLRFLDALTLEQIGALHRVNRSTAHRWLVDAQGRLAGAIESELRTRLQLSPSELRSLAGLVQSQLDLGLTQLLRTRG